MRSDWYLDFFQGVTVEFWRRAAAPELTAVEAGFLAGIFPAGSRLLDAPCGTGRHALALGRRGYRVVGVDGSAEFLADGRAELARGVQGVELVQADIQDLPVDGDFDGAYCFGNSFGYFEYPGMVRFVRRVAAVLKPGGRFVVQTGMAAESILPQLETEAVYEVGDIRMTLHNRYDAANSCLETEGFFDQAGRRESRRWWHWVYTVGELRRLLGTAGLEVVDLYGSMDRTPYRVGDPQLLLVAAKTG